MLKTEVMSKRMTGLARLRQMDVHTRNVMMYVTTANTYFSPKAGTPGLRAPNMWMPGPTKAPVGRPSVRRLGKPGVTLGVMSVPQFTDG